jgi:hypothetical protein
VGEGLWDLLQNRTSVERSALEVGFRKYALIVILEPGLAFPEESFK